MRGTPTLILLDRQGCIGPNHFGRMDDLRVGATIGQLINETVSGPYSNQYREQSVAERGSCDGKDCAISESVGTDERIKKSVFKHVTFESLVSFVELLFDNGLLLKY